MTSPPAMEKATAVWTAWETFACCLAAIKLRDNNRSARRQTDKKADQQVDNHSGRTAYCGQAFLSHKPAYDNGVYRIVKLLKKVPNRMGKKKSRSCFQITPSVI